MGILLRKMVTIYAPRESVRLVYIVSHLFQNILGTDYEFVDEKEVFLKRKGACINYSDTDLNKGIRILPHSLLYEKGVMTQLVQTGVWKGLPCFFLQPEGDIPFDIFAASFYLLTRYEEYDYTDYDSHGRYPPEASLACKEKFLEIPLVDRWIQALKDVLTDGSNNLDCIPRQFRIVSTFDIDHPYLYLNKGVLKNLSGGIKDILGGNRKALSVRFRTLLHFRSDPFFDAFKNIVAIYRDLGRDFFAFIHVGKYGKFDRRTIYPHRRFYSYIRSLYDVRFGIHPSYRASFDSELIRDEKKRLEKILGYQIKRSRQHFLRMRLPDTYRSLNAMQIEEDFTMTYASVPGFRASTAIPFHFFDLETDRITALLIRPTIVMDATFIGYLNASSEEALEKYKHLMDESYKSSGDFIMLWHNSNLTNPDKNEWFRVFEEVLKRGIELEGRRSRVMP